MVVEQRRARRDLGVSEVPPAADLDHITRDRDGHGHDVRGRGGDRHESGSAGGHRLPPPRGGLESQMWHVAAR